MTDTESNGARRIAFMCVQNAGRSQMSTAFAEREVERRGLAAEVEIITGGTHPADAVHDEVVDVMGEVGFDLSDRRPQEITLDELRQCDYVATMGCSTLDVGEVGEETDVRDWALPDPDGEDLATVREIRDDIEQRVSSLFDEIAKTD
jgi:arsenate reductase